MTGSKERIEVITSVQDKIRQVLYNTQYYIHEEQGHHLSFPKGSFRDNFYNLSGKKLLRF